MDVVLAMHVFEAEANVNEDAPHGDLVEVTVLPVKDGLFFQKGAQVPIMAVFNYNIYLRLIYLLINE